MIPCSIRPVATVPRPVMENTSSTGIRNGLSRSRTGSGGYGGRAGGGHGELARGADYERDVVAGELVLRQQIADLDLDELEKLRVVDHVSLVEEDDDVGHA